MTSLAVCIPNFACIDGVFLDHLMPAWTAFVKAHPDWEMFYIRDFRTYRHLAREALAEKALVLGADFIFFLDDDMCLAPDTINRLIDAQRPIVSALYYLRVSNGLRTQPVAYLMAGEPEDGSQYWRAIADWGSLPQDRLVPVDGVGAGALLIERHVFEKMERDVGRPWFRMNGKLGEDIGFCINARKAGFSIMLDTGALVGHLTRQPTVIDQEYYDEHEKSGAEQNEL